MDNSDLDPETLSIMLDDLAFAAFYEGYNKAKFEESGNLHTQFREARYRAMEKRGKDKMRLKSDIMDAVMGAAGVHIEFPFSHTYSINDIMDWKIGDGSLREALYRDVWSHLKLVNHKEWSRALEKAEDSEAFFTDIEFSDDSTEIVVTIWEK